MGTQPHGAAHAPMWGSRHAPIRERLCRVSVIAIAIDCASATRASNPRRCDSLHMAIFGDSTSRVAGDDLSRQIWIMRVAGWVLGMVVVVVAVRADADPQATESPRVASVHDGMMLGGAIALGLQSSVDLRVGWMVHPRVAVFGTGLWAGSITNDSSRRLVGVGARLWITDRAFLEGRLGQGLVRDDTILANIPMEMHTETRGVGAFAGLGVEIVRWKHFGLELHTEATLFAGEGALTGGLGITFY